MKSRRNESRGRSLERAALVGLVTRAARRADPDTILDELEGLARAAGAEVVVRALQDRSSPDAATFIGQGKAETLALACAELKADLVIFDNELTPAQSRNLEKVFGRRVIDRTELILDIFAKRARTREGRLQVELAQLQYRLPRLAGSSDALSRLGGGIGTRGPGETKLETDRRRIRDRIASLKREIADVGRRRGYLRDRRRRGDVPTVALVGYTNAGKTTLFNALTGARAVVSHALFVTLDPLVRRLRLGDAGQILLSDTVGFIERLPHQLVAAFRATLEEVANADLLVHVVDAASPDRDRHLTAVRHVLDDVGAASVPTIEAWNKIDLVDPEERARLQTSPHGEILISARQRDGLDALERSIAAHLSMDTARVRFDLNLRREKDRKTVAELYKMARVVTHVADGDRVEIDADVPRRLLGRFPRAKGTGMRSGARKSLVAALAFSIVACGPKPAPVAPSAPRYPDYPVPVIPPALVVAEALRARHSEAWQLLQSGDVRGASRAFTENLRAMPDLYPSETGLGYALLAQKDFDLAAKRFASATSKNANYLPAWVGAAEANMARGADADAIVALEHILALDPQRPETKSRLELLRFKQLPAMIEAGQRARRAERWDEARMTLEKALAMSPTSPVILRELALVELGTGALPAAETRARRAVAVDDRDAESHATLAMVLEARGNGRGAADEYDRAVALDPRPEWREKATNLRSSAELAVIPPEFRTVPTAATVTRAQVAAYIGIRLERLIGRAPARVTEVATDVRNHWASPWILPVTRAGIMEIQPNHLFEPAAQVRRGDLARIVSQLLAIIPQRQMDLVRWRQAKPRFADVPPTHVFYSAAALAVSAGAMNPDAGTRFDPTRPASGPDLVAAIGRVEEIAGR